MSADDNTGLARHPETALPPEIVDIGLNLAHDSFDHDRDRVVQRAVDAGVRRMILTGSSLESTRAALAMVRAAPDRFRCTAGMHPHHASQLDEARMAELATLASAPGVVAVGECGLDYFRNLSPPADQRSAFERQLALAAQIGKPVFLHERDAHRDFVAMLRQFRPRLAGGVAHCFTASAAEASAYLDLDLYVGITGWICDERRGLELREAVRHIPRDRLLIETDAPYLLPRDLTPKPSGRRNEPCYLPHVLQAVASARGEAAVDLAEATTRNALRLFGWQAIDRLSVSTHTTTAALP